jgi:hypothetical protein
MPISDLHTIESALNLAAQWERLAKRQAVEIWKARGFLQSMQAEPELTQAQRDLIGDVIDWLNVARLCPVNKFNSHDWISFACKYPSVEERILVSDGSAVIIWPWHKNATPDDVAPFTHWQPIPAPHSKT